MFSLIPLPALYLKKHPAPYTNSDAVKKLKNNTEGHFEFIVMGDCHSGLPFNDSATLKLVYNINREDRFKKLPVDFVAIAGDLTFRGSKWDYSVFNKIRAMIKFPVISAIGNHDDDKNGAAHFKKYIAEKEFSFANRNSYFIVVDNGSGDLTEEQFSYLESELKKSSSYAHRFVILHKTPLSPYQQSWYRPELNPWAERFMKLCDRHKVDMVFSGHEHMFRSRKLGSVEYMVSGGGGMLIHLPSSGGGFLHYVVIRVYGDYVDYEVRKIFPPLWEFFAYYMWKDLIYFVKDVLL